MLWARKPTDPGIPSRRKPGNRSKRTDTRIVYTKLQINLVEAFVDAGFRIDDIFRESNASSHNRPCSGKSGVGIEDHAAQTIPLLRSTVG